jgi:hypothetical protein
MPEVWFCHARDSDHVVVVTRDDYIFVSSGKLSRLLPKSTSSINSRIAASEHNGCFG